MAELIFSHQQAHPLRPLAQGQSVLMLALRPPTWIVLPQGGR